MELWTKENKPFGCSDNYVALCNARLLLVEANKQLSGYNPTDETRQVQSAICANLEKMVFALMHMEFREAPKVDMDAGFRKKVR